MLHGGYCQDVPPDVLFEDVYTCQTCFTKFSDPVELVYHNVKCSGRQKEDECCDQYDTSTRSDIYDTMLNSAKEHPEVLLTEFDQELEELDIAITLSLKGN